MSIVRATFLNAVNVGPYLTKHPTGLYAFDGEVTGSDVFEAIYANAGLLDATAPLHETFGDFMYRAYKNKPIHPDATSRVPGSDSARLARKMNRLAVSAAEHQRAAADDLRAIWSVVIHGWGDIGARQASKPKYNVNMDK